MMFSLEHRGPDANGKFTDGSNGDGISLGHTRLKIIDLSEKAAQPMENEDGSLQLVFNGEIYNFRELRASLEAAGHKFKSDSDSEVIVHAYEEYGADCASRFEGMFAFALWDSKKKTLFGARDHAGIKPLYYYFNGSEFVFASEIKTILQCDAIKREIDEAALASLVDNLFVTGNRTLFKGVRELPPGSAFVFDAKNKSLKISRYWSPQLNLGQPELSPDAASRMLESALSESVKSTLISDVPLGVALSGGLDSSIVAALAAKADAKLKTFTVGFGLETDEFVFARKVAEHVGSDHEELHVSLDGLSKSIPEIVWHLESPPTRTAVAPTFLLARKIRKSVTVELLGEGGDELFGGYERYEQFEKNPFNGNEARLRETFFKRGSEKDYFALDKDSREAETTKVNMEETADCPAGESVNCALIYDFKNQLPGVQLNRVDKMTMASSVEARVPFLNKTVIETAFQIPSALKIKGGNVKFVLKRVAARYIPKEIIERKKVGMQTPLDEWFKTEFVGVAERILDEKNIRGIKYLKPDGVKRLIAKNKLLRGAAAPFDGLGGSAGWGARKIENYYSGRLWFLSMLAVWHKLYVEPDVLRNPGNRGLKDLF